MIRHVLLTMIAGLLWAEGDVISPSWGREPVVLDFNDLEAELIESALASVLLGEHISSTRDFYAPGGSRYILVDDQVFHWDDDFQPDIAGWQRVLTQDAIGEQSTLAIRIGALTRRDRIEDGAGRILFIIWAGYATNQVGGARAAYRLDYATGTVQFAGLND